MGALPQYQYKLLSSPSQFRLLELLPGNEDDPISYLLHTADWKCPSAYEAVSYAWGDVNDTYPSICDGFQQTISVNLRDGLIAMRAKDRSRLLWVDAICIDQANTEERGQQVSHMRLIYEGATRVLVWLGPDVNSKGKQAITAIKEIGRECLRKNTRKMGIDELSLSSVDELWGVLPTERLDGLYSDNPETWKTIAWLFSRSWFSRLWVIQEVNSNRNVQVLCGGSQVSWDVAILVASYIRRHPTINRYSGFHESNYTNAYYMRRRFWFQQVSLPSLLNWGRSFKASEPLDRVYALMGMPPFLEIDCQWAADYSLSKRALYEDVAIRSIRQMQNLRVLSYSQHFEEERDFPSWVPQWDREPYYREINDSLTKVHWKASGNKPLLENLQITPGVLRVAGCVFDSVKSLHPLGEAVWSHHQSDHPAVKLWESEKSKPTTYPTGETNIEALSLVMTTGVGQNLRKASENMNLLKANFEAYLGQLLRGSGHDSTAYSPVEETETAGDLFLYEDLVTHKCRNRALLCTVKGYLGLGPVCEVGDLVCVLFGGETPFILRPKNGCFLFVGDVYVHGIMEGEAVKALNMYRTTQFEIH